MELAERRWANVHPWARVYLHIDRFHFHSTMDAYQFSKALFVPPSSPTRGGGLPSKVSVSSAALPSFGKSFWQNCIRGIDSQASLGEVTDVWAGPSTPSLRAQAKGHVFSDASVSLASLYSLWSSKLLLQSALREHVDCDAPDTYFSVTPEANLIVIVIVSPGCQGYTCVTCSTCLTRVQQTKNRAHT